MQIQTLKKRISSCGWIFGLLFLMVLGMVFSGRAMAAETLTLSTSAQIYEVFKGTTVLEDFTKKTGVEVKLDITTSDAAESRLVNGVADIAAVAKRLDYRHKAAGYMEHPFAKDALVFITNAETQTTDMTEDNLRSIFSGDLTNWKDIGGEDMPFIKVIPSKDTALFQNFSRMLMEGNDVEFDVMTAKSTFAQEVARRFKGAVSFVNQGATRGKPAGAKVITIDGKGPGDSDYPYYQVFSILTKGEPTGAVKTLLDYIYSEEFGKKMIELGVKPYKP